MATPQDNENHRNAPRRRVLKAAQIVCDGGQTVVECMIRDISETGAKIDTEVTLALPASFWVFLQDGVRRQAELVWQKGNLLGVRFADAQGAQLDAADGGNSALIARIAEIEKQLAELRVEIAATLRD